MLALDAGRTVVIPPTVISDTGPIASRRDLPHLVDSTRAAG